MTDGRIERLREACGYRSVLLDGDLDSLETTLERLQGRQDALSADNAALRAQNARYEEALKIARVELTKWGWGDFHYGSSDQELSVVETMMVIDAAMASPQPDGETWADRAKARGIPEHEVRVPGRSPGDTPSPTRPDLDAIERAIAARQQLADLLWPGTTVPTLLALLAYTRRLEEALAKLQQSRPKGDASEIGSAAHYWLTTVLPLAASQKDGVSWMTDEARTSPKERR